MTDQLANAGNEPVAEVSLRDELAAEYAKMSEPANTAEPAAQPETTEPQETAEEAEQRARDEKGRFAPKATKEDEEPQPETTEEPAQPDATKYVGPPPGWSVASKAAFDELPDAVKADIAKREREIDQGFAKLKEFKGLEPYVDAARQHNITLPELMGRYQKAEQFLQRDPTNAILWMCQNYGVDPRQLAGPQGQLAGQQAQAQEQQKILNPDIQPLLQEINNLKQQLGRVDAIEQSLHSEKFNQVSQSVESFFADPKNKYSENVADQMVVLINQAKASGQPVDLASIYETACYMNPEVRTALINEQTKARQAEQAAKARQTATQARAAGASITGGPSATPPTAEPDSDNLRALLEQGYAAQMGRT
jgi:hypothetical protein